MLSALNRERPQHQLREVDAPFLFLIRRIRTDDETELALIALVDDALVLLTGQLAGVVAPTRLVDHLEQRPEARAELDADPAITADVKRSIALDPRGSLIEPRRIERIVKMRCQLR